MPPSNPPSSSPGSSRPSEPFDLPFRPDPSQTPPQESAPQPDASLVLKLGTLVVIGAMAANVIGFRYSRWAVGKDIHRAWERQQRQRRVSTESHAEQHLRRMREAFTRSEQHRAAEQARAREERTAAAAAAQRRRAERERAEREDVRTRYAQWEARFDRDARFGMQFDAKLIEEMLQQLGQATSRMGFRVRGGAFSMDEQMMEQLLRAARQAQKRQRGAAGSDSDNDAFRFWEAMNGAQWRHYARDGANTGGVHQRVGMARHYQALGLQQGASEEQVKRAYRQEVMKWHPDRYRGNDKSHAAQRFRQVTDAYAALTKKD